jgi:glycosyltransferase involved in cell wall biosynthesis
MFSSSICIIGRCTFGTGIGTTTFAACELLNRYYDVSVLPTEPHLRHLDEIVLPNGTHIAVCKEPSEIRVAFYTDVLWNGAHDFNYMLVPEGALRIAHVAYDSDEFPSQWVQILNDRFDFVLFMSRHLEEVAHASGIEIDVGTLPLALDLESSLSRPFRPYQAGTLKFLSVAAFHTRKGTESLVDAFLASFGDRTDVELTIHSNLAIGACYERIKSKLLARGVSNIVISNEALTDEQKNSLIESCDIFVNCSRGEGFSIGPREALAYGKPLVVTDVGGHKDLSQTRGVFVVPAILPLPARYPEIDNLVIGRQFGARVEDISRSLEEARTFVAEGNAEVTARERRTLAAQFSFSLLANDYARLINPDLHLFRPSKAGSSFTRWPSNHLSVVNKKIGRRNELLPGTDRTIVPSHDGGFFSVFNTFISHLVWDQQETRSHMVLPDWNVGRMMSRFGTEKFVSFCYGRPEDGNIWNKLFEPLFGLTPQEMDDPKVLYAKGRLPNAWWNQDREPQLTYVHAYKLYKSAQFRNVRRQYHAVLKQHIHLLPEYKSELDSFVSAKFTNKFIIAAHVKHPSHVLEQPGGEIAHTDAFIEAIRGQLARRDMGASDNSWRIFLATDQDRVVKRFDAEFGDRVVYYTDVRRTREEEDARFDNLTMSQQSAEGFQVQHLVAANKENWNVRMAWEVIRDAMTMARCNVLLHVVSNVSTAVSFFNPDVELIFCSPRRNVDSRKM